MMSSVQTVNTDVYMPVIQTFVVVIDDRSSSAETVDEAMLQLFAQKRRPTEAILPTGAAQLQHTKRERKLYIKVF